MTQGASEAQPTGLLVQAPAALACGALPSDILFDGVYLDPPYGVGTEMMARSKQGEARGRRQKASGPSAYRDSANVDDLVGMISGAVSAIRERMRPHACLFIHLDQRAVHETKVACDEVLGRGAFAGEIIWLPGNGAKGKGLPMTHQTLLVYARSPADRKHLRWNIDDPALREPYAKTSLGMHFTNVDEEGRRFRERHVGGKTYRYYADQGRRIGSVWADLPAMRANTPLMSEGTGYPTQKPLGLLERIVLASTQPGETMADLMCGSGTTLVAASRHQRRFVGGDQSDLAIQTSTERLLAEGISYRLLKLSPS